MNKKMCSFRLSDQAIDVLNKISQDCVFSKAEIIEILLLSFAEDCPYSINTLYCYAYPRKEIKNKEQLPKKTLIPY